MYSICLRCNVMAVITWKLSADCFYKAFFVPAKHEKHIASSLFMTTTSSKGQLLTEALKWFLVVDQSASDLVYLIDSSERNCKWSHVLQLSSRKYLVAMPKESENSTIYLLGK